MPQSRRDERDTCGHVCLAGSSSQPGNNTFVPSIRLQLQLQTFSMRDQFFLVDKKCVCSRGERDLARFAMKETEMCGGNG